MEKIKTPNIIKEAVVARQLQSVTVNATVGDLIHTRGNELLTIFISSFW